VSETPRVDAWAADNINGPDFIRADDARELERENAALRAELERLKEIEHCVWHMLDDSEERVDTNEVVITLPDQGYYRLIQLLEQDDDEPVYCPIHGKTDGGDCPRC